MNQEEAYWITGDLTLDVVARKAFYGKKHIKLSDLSFNVLKTLVQSYPISVSHQAMIDQVWQKVAVSPETVTQRIALIRKAFVDVGFEHDRYMVATRHIGYRWTKAVKKQNTPTFRDKNLWIMFALLISVLFVCLGLILHQSTDRDQPQIKSSASFSADDLSEQAWHYLDKHESKSNSVAIGLFRKSLVKNPNHLNALTGLSVALSHQVTKFNQSDGLLAEAQKAAELAVSLDPSHAQAWAALAFVYDARGELQEAVLRYEKALVLNPQNTSTASSLAYLYGVQGRLVEALQMNVNLLGSKQLYLDLQIAHVLDLLGFDTVAEQWYERADELSPDNVFATHSRARYYLSRSLYQQSLNTVNSAMNRGVQRPELPLVKGVIAWIQGDTLLAKSAFEDAVKIDPTSTEAQVWLFIVSNPIDLSDAAKQNFKGKWFKPPDSWPNHWVYQAIFYAYFSDDKRAVENLEKAFLAGYRNHRWLKHLPPLQALNSNELWMKLLEAMQKDVNRQRSKVLDAEWLPESFLDPKT